MKKVGIVFLGICVALVLGELSVRAYGLISRSRLVPNGMRTEGEKEAQKQGVNVLHPYFGYVRDSTTDLTVNRFGFIGDPPIQEKSPNKLIVAVFGGSVATNLSAFHKDFLIAELKKIPAFSNKEIVIITLSNPGYRQPQQLLILNYFLTFGAVFDIVINIDGFNEVAQPYSDNVAYHLYAFYPKFWILFTRKSGPSEIPQTDEIGRIQQFQRTLGALVSRWPFNHSVLALASWNALDKIIGNILYQKRDELSERLAKHTETKYQWDIKSYDSLDALTQDTVMVWKNASIQMSVLAAANGARYFQFLQANQYVPGSKVLTDEEKKIAYYSGNDEKNSGYKYRKAVEFAYPNLVAEVANLQKKGIASYDVTMMFKNVRETIYSDPCCHYNRYGNLLLAKKIAEIIANTL